MFSGQPHGVDCCCPEGISQLDICPMHHHLVVSFWGCFPDPNNCSCLAALDQCGVVGHFWLFGATNISGKIEMFQTNPTVCHKYPAGTPHPNWKPWDTTTISFKTKSFPHVVCEVSQSTQTHCWMFPRFAGLSLQGTNTFGVASCFQNQSLLTKNKGACFLYLGPPDCAKDRKAFRASKKKPQVIQKLYFLESLATITMSEWNVRQVCLSSAIGVMVTPSCVDQGHKGSFIWSEYVLHGLPLNRILEVRLSVKISSHHPCPAVCSLLRSILQCLWPHWKFCSGKTSGLFCSLFCTFVLELYGLPKWAKRYELACLWKVHMLVITPSTPRLKKITFHADLSEFGVVIFIIHQKSFIQVMKLFIGHKSLKLRVSNTVPFGQILCVTILKISVLCAILIGLGCQWTRGVSVKHWFRQFEQRQENKDTQTSCSNRYSMHVCLVTERGKYHMTQNYWQTNKKLAGAKMHFRHNLPQRKTCTLNIYSFEQQDCFPLQTMQENGFPFLRGDLLFHVVFYACPSLSTLQNLPQQACCVKYDSNKNRSWHKHWKLQTNVINKHFSKSVSWMENTCSKLMENAVLPNPLWRNDVNPKANPFISFRTNLKDKGDQPGWFSTNG